MSIQQSYRSNAGVHWLVRNSLLGLSIGTLLSGCQDQAAGAESTFKIKLVDLSQAVISQMPSLAPLATLLDDDFSQGLGDWQPSTSVELPLSADPTLLQASFPSAGQNQHLRLSGTRGVLYQLIPVQPECAYRFSARTRAIDLKSPNGFGDAKPYLAELTRSGPREVLMASTPTEPLVHVRHQFRTSLGVQGWLKHERTFVTGSQTKTLLVVANLSFAGGIEGGSVDFDDFLLQQVPLRAAWEESLALAQADYGRGERPHGDWRDARLIRGYLGAEVRPSIISFPGESTGFLIDVPSTKPLMEVGVGPWPAALLPGAKRHLNYEIRVGGESLWTKTQEVDASTLEDGWLNFELDLTPWAGKQVELELLSDGELPGLFGSPTLRSQEPQPDKKNLILISLDTLRADFVGSYGAEGNPTPRLDAFAAAGIRCANVQGQAPYTLPGHATMFSGQYPSVHGAQRPSQTLSGTRSPILARILSQAGYRTEAFTGGGLMNADFGFDKGFDRFSNIDPLRHKDSAFFLSMLADEPAAKQRLRRNHQGPARVTQEMIDRYGPEQLNTWLGEHKDEPFFLFVHTYSVHDYDPPDEFLACRTQGCNIERRDYNEFRLTHKQGQLPAPIPEPQPITDAERDHMRHLYDGTVRQADHLVGKLLDRVQELGLDKNTIIAIATDHGEEMFERGYQQHGKTLYEEMTRLPLMLQIPGEEPRVIEEPVMMIDLAPTLLEALGLGNTERMNGRSLLHPIPKERSTYSEIHDDFVHKYALRTSDGYKLIYAPLDEVVHFPARNEWQLFQVQQDPLERTDLAEQAPDVLKKMQALMQQRRERLEALAEKLDSEGASQMSESTKKQLDKLGY